MLGIYRSTPRRVILRYVQEGRIENKPFGERRNVPVDAEAMTRCLQQIVYKNCAAMQERFCDKNAARNANLPLRECRKLLLLAAIERNIASISISKFAAWFRHMQTYVRRDLARGRT